MSAAVRTTDGDGRVVQNQGYAIAADRLRTVLSGLRDGRSPAWTGLTLSYPTPQQLAARRLPTGLVATGAVAGSPAARSGLGTGAPDEALVAVDDRPVGSTLTAYCASVTRAGGPAAPQSVTFARGRLGPLAPRVAALSASGAVSLTRRPCAAAPSRRARARSRTVTPLAMSTIQPQPGTPEKPSKAMDARKHTNSAVETAPPEPRCGDDPHQDMAAVSRWWRS
jgi:hypothetical protein